MSRAVTADHVLFDECIHAFRRPGESHPPFMEGDSKSFLLTSFHIQEAWEFPHTRVLPSFKFTLPGAWSSFICTIENPAWVGTHNAHLYGLALSAIVSFVTGMPCQSTRDDYLCRQQKLTEYELMELAVHHPVLVAGPGGVSTHLSQKTLSEYESSIGLLITRLHEMPLKNYRKVMQAIRLVHLSLLNKKNDFGLAYLLVISAIEAIAQEAIDKKIFKKKHPLESKLIARYKNDSEFVEFFDHFKKIRSQNSHLKERYVRFIKEFAPHECWEEIVPHQMQKISEYIHEISPEQPISHLTQKSWHESYPKDLPIELINEILESSYKHRSCFIHTGEQPPHSDPNSYNRFFQEIYRFEEGGYKKFLLPNYSLMLAIAQTSITRWALIE